ncbi:MAG: membrane bound O-acyl transferase family-domain-containing protein [Deltaproteobacteria bacterium]|nr:membrane bound O-acyl transferase family-domain-containing protein [Deltaproteobacteria bacterium]
MGLLAGVGTAMGVGIMAAVALEGGRGRRRVGLGVAILGLLIPFLLSPADAFGRFVVGLTTSLAVIRSIDLYRSQETLPWWRRGWHNVAIFDTRLARPMPRRLNGALFGLSIAWAALGAAALCGALMVPVEAPVGRGARWIGGAVAAVALLESFTRFLRMAYEGIGVAIPDLHDSPYLSRSVREFWGRRWNKVVGTWLRQNCYEPFRENGRPFVGQCAAFAASALLHWYLAFVALGFMWSLAMGAFFLLQVALIGAEDKFGVHQWSRLAAHSWTVAVMLAVSPLFIEPFLLVVASAAPGSAR